MKHFQFLLLAFAFVTFAAVAPTQRAHAAIQLTVTNCNNQNELRAKIVELQEAFGGTLNFNCGTKTIVLSAQLPLIEYETTIDGGNKITLNGNDNVRLVQVGATGNLTLKNIVLDHGLANAADGGAITNVGQLTLNHVTLQNNRANYGGAIYNNGTLDITNSTLKNNTAIEGGAIYADSGTSLLTISHSAFAENRANQTNLGGAIYSAGAFDITNTQFTKNKAGSGGAIYARKLYPNTNGAITDSTFNANETTGADNFAKGGALVVENLPVTISRSQLQSNRSTSGGAIYVGAEAQLSLDTGTLAGNHALYGGVLFNAGVAGASQVTLSNNDAMFGGAIDNYGVLWLTNATLSGNQGQYGDALMNDSGSATLVSVTVVTTNSNTSNGGAIWNDNVYGPKLSLTNVLLSNSRNGIGVNCTFYTAPTISTHNLSNDNSCGFGAGRDNADLKLGPLANNGGPTLTHLPQTDSPAIDSGTYINIPTIDQRGVSRPQRAGYDVGAVEAECPKPVKPTLLAPLDKKKAAGPVIHLDWNDDICTGSYQVRIRLGSPTGTLVQKKGGLVSSEFTTKALTKGQTYAWQVIAVNSAGKTKSDWWTFKVK